MAGNTDNLPNIERGIETKVHEKKGFFPKLIQLWKEGLKSMTWGKPLWILNIVKLLIMFGILKVFFFPNFLKQKADTEEGRRNYVANELVERASGQAEAELDLSIKSK